MNLKQKMLNSKLSIKTDNILLLISLCVLSFLFLNTSFCFAQNGHWEELKPLHSPPPRCNFGMADIGENNVIIFGGDSDGGDLNDTWIYDLKSKDWTEVTSEPKPSKRYNHRLARITDNKVILLGGDGYNDDTWIFDLDSNRWFEIYPKRKPISRSEFALAQIERNKVLLYSGTGYNGDCIASDTWIYNIEVNEWDSIKTCNKFSYGMDVGCTMLDTGKVITFSGWAFIEQEETGIFDINIQYWRKIQPKQKATPKGQCTMAGISKNTVLLFSGSGKGSVLVADTWLFSLYDTTWIPLTSLNIAPRGRTTHGMAKIGDGRVLLFGGITEGDYKHAGDTWLFTLDTTGTIINEPNLSESKPFQLNFSDNKITLTVINPLQLDIDIYDILGRKLHTINTGNLIPGEYSFPFNSNLNNNGLYLITALCENIKYTYKYLHWE